MRCSFCFLPFPASSRHRLVVSGYCVKEEPGRTVVLFIFDLFHHISTQNYKQKIIETKNFDLILPKMNISRNFIEFYKYDSFHKTDRRTV